ncbi:hypothetical protein D9619_003954 [Psilocybe cf. subviscida]|uniref:Uncharacterized protein n=1 Tax=Psilocybe cf. subviscida TaxID=2480587 RepID=A0A8H5BQ04_9AGAR|nr:hypothetical protein D9619_003954 [Psilocybe cf. subviscida]
MGFSLKFLKLLEQATIEAGIWSTLIQTLLTGVYTMIFVQTITPILRTGQEKVYAAVLTLIFMAITANLATSWKMLRVALILNNDTRFSMAKTILVGNAADRVVLNFTSRSAILLADIIMIWRCYTLWARNKRLLLIFSLLLLGEFVLLLKLTPANLSSTDIKGGAPAFNFISSAITILATVLIILRIVMFVNKSEGGLGFSGSYTLIIKIILESGVLYTVSLMATSILYLIVILQDDMSSRAVKLAEGLLIWLQALVPITGIATTLIAFHVATGRANDEATLSQSKPTSTLQFEGMGAQTQYSVTFIPGEQDNNDGTDGIS